MRILRHTTISLGLLAALLGSSFVMAEEGQQQRQRPTPEQRAQHREQMKERWNKLDANHDGKLSKEEAQQGAPRLAEHFDQLDLNHDGQVTPEELRQARENLRGQRQGGQRQGAQRPQRPAGVDGTGGQ